MFEWTNQSWYAYLDVGQQDLVRVAEALLRREVEEKQQTFYDYAFIVFPMAKAYEGFLKKFMYELGIISLKQYEGEHFRIGKSLNPDLPVKYRRNDWVVERLDRICGRVETEADEKVLLSQVLWQEWKESRNVLFHYFPQRENFISLEEAEERLVRLAEVMEAAMGCQVKKEANLGGT